jgi:hypothetical protein
LEVTDMNDITNFRLSKAANDVADKLVTTGKFDHGTSAAKFAFAYAVKNFYEKFDPSTYVISDSNGSNYSVGSFDDLAPYVKVLYPDTDTPYIYVRALIVFGLIEIGKVIDSGGMLKIYSLCE